MKITTPTTDRKPQAITDAEQAVADAAAERTKAKAALVTAEAAAARTDEADADAYDAAEAAGKPAPSKLPSVGLRAAHDAAAAKVRALTTRHQRAVERLAETYRTEAGAWYAAEVAIAERAEAECLAALAVLVETFDRAREARALADWTATTRSGVPQPFTGPERPSGEELLVARVRNVLGIEARELAAQARRERQAAKDRAAAAEQAEIERQAEAVRRQSEYEAGEEQQRVNYVAALGAGGLPTPVRVAPDYQVASPEVVSALDELLAVKTSPDLGDLLIGADRA